MGKSRQKHWLRRPKQAPMPVEIWNVFGVSQHGDMLNFDETTSEAAHQHASRLNRLGGSVRVRRILWSASGAGYFPEDHWRVRRLSSPKR